MPILGYFDTIFANSGDVTTVPDATQSDGTISYEKGFPTLYSVPVSSGGYNVPRRQTNQLYKDITTAIQYLQQGNYAAFITSAMNNGSPYSYPQYARVLYSGIPYVSLEASNTDTPPSAKWAVDFGRILLTQNTTYYVATTGSDSNDGSVSSPWLTLQYAINYVKNMVDLGGYAVTISVADGTYGTGFSASGGFTGGGTVTILGNATTPSSCIISSTGICIATSNSTNINISGLKLISANSHLIQANTKSLINISGNMNFGAAASGFSHLLAQDGSQIIVANGYTISGGGGFHLNAFNRGQINLQTITAGLTGTPNFSSAFATAQDLSLVYTPTAAFSGSATGSRYSSSSNSVINTATASANYFPGNSAGSTASGGIYL